MNLRFKLSFHIPCICFSAALVFSTARAESPENVQHPVEVKLSGQTGWQLFRNGEPYAIHGAGGQVCLDLLARLGGNSMRTWGERDLEKTDRSGNDLLGQAQEKGLTVIAGIWIGHPRHGFNYNDPVQVEQQRRAVREAVRRYKDHPALLIWGLGNEVELLQKPEMYPQLFSELNVLAKIVKEEDPEHPVMTAFAEINPQKIQAVMKYYPALDILGVNSYRSAGNVPDVLRKAGWTGPYILSEFGPDGPWERPKTSWGAPIEPVPLEKLAMYQRAFEKNMASQQCIGTYAFYWGTKQECTETWFNLLLPSGEKTPVVDYLSHQWTGNWPENRSPVIESLLSDIENQEILPGSIHLLQIKINEPDGDRTLSEAWVVKESADRKNGGDAETAPARIPGCFKVNRTEFELSAPVDPGSYRVFIRVSDEKGGACIYPFAFSVK